MLIYFIYQNNTFTIELKKDVSITFLYNLVSKRIQRDKSNFDLYYNSKKLSEKDSTLFQMAKNENSIVVIISLKKNLSKDKSVILNKDIKFPLLDLKTESESKNNQILTENQLFEKSFAKDMNKHTKLKLRLNTPSSARRGKTEYLSMNKVFEDVYNAKEEEIKYLMKDLKIKILEFDDILYHNYKNSFNRDNSQLLLYEKNIINYKEKQIKYLKQLINYFDTREASFFSMGKINLDDFYVELSNYYYNKNSRIQNDLTKKEKQLQKDFRMANYSEKNLPKIILNKSSTEENLPSSNKISEDSIYSDEIIREKIDKYLNNKKENINHFEYETPLEKINKRSNRRNVYRRRG